MNFLKDKKILLIVTGGIACYKALDLIRRLQDKGSHVECVLTSNAQEFVKVITFESLLAKKVKSNLFTLDQEKNMNHIKLANDAEITSVSPKLKINFSGTSELTSAYNNNAATLAINDTINGAQIVLRGQSPKLIFDQTAGGNGSMYYDTQCLLFYQGVPTGTPVEKVRFNGGGINVSGAVTATAFVGDGSGLTGVGTQTNLGSFDNLVVAGIATFNHDVGVSGTLTASRFGLDDDNNFIAGPNAGIAITPAITSSACNNFMVGCNAGKRVLQGHNVLIGCNTGCANVSSSNLIAIGLCAGQNVVEGQDNVLVGRAAGLGLTTTKGIGGARRNVMIGNYTGCSVQNECNVMIGPMAGERLRGSKKNVIIGVYAGRGVSGATDVGTGGGGEQNTIIGFAAGSSFRGGYFNVILGSNSGSANSTGGCNVFLGLRAGQKNISGGQNVFIGKYAGCSSTTTFSNVAIGNNASRCGNPTNGIFIGNGAGKGASGCAHTGNIAIGVNAGLSLSTGGYNTLLGQGAGSCLCSGGFNVILGQDAGGNNVKGSYNVAIGCAAMRASGSGNVNSNPSHNVVLGRCAGFALSTLFPPSAAGTYAGFSNI